MTSERVLVARFLGRVPYQDGVLLQQECRTELLAARDRREAVVEEHLLLLEHDPVYTVGRNADGNDVVAGRDWLDQRGIEVVETDRGGQVTYHGPGQLVVYPIIDLSPDRRDVRRYVRDLEQVIVDTLTDFGIASHPGDDASRIGVWVGSEKIASIGVHLKRWVTTHGLAINVDTDLTQFGGIVACGLPGVSMTSIVHQTGRKIELEEVARRCARHFARIFERRLAESIAASRSAAAGSEATPDGIFGS